MTGLGGQNNVHAQLDSPQEPTQPPLNPEIILEDENEQENGAAQQTPKDKKMKKKNWKTSVGKNGKLLKRWP